MADLTELLDEHVTLRYESIDRLLLNGYVSRIQSREGLACFLKSNPGEEIPRYAILGTRDGVRWGLFRMTQNNDELVRCINQLLDLGQAACVVRPRSTSR